MKGIDVNKRSIGVNFTKNNEAEILVWSPTAEQIVVVAGNDQIQLNREDFGYWRITTSKVKPGSQYKILLNNKDQYPDPASLSQPNGVHERSEAIDLKKFQWTDEQWDNIPLEDYIIYELHTG